VPDAERHEQNLGELELDALKVIWKHEPCTVQQATEVLGEQRGCARTTVLTIMQRLHAKGFLKRRKQDGVFRYTATRDRRQTLGRLTQQFVDTVLDGSALPMVAYLAQSGNLTRQERAKLESIVRDIEKKTREEQ